MRTLFLLAWAALLLGLPAASGAQQWPLEAVTIEKPGTHVSRFIYVPQGERYDTITLSATLPSYDDSQRLSILLNDTLVHNQRWHQATTLDIALPSLAPGFHRLDIIGWPAIESASDTGQCPIIQASPLRVAELMLTYRIIDVGPATLSALPEGLYNPNHPRPPLGQLKLEEPTAYSAAARLISGWSFDNSPRWQVVQHQDASEEAQVLVGQAPGQRQVQGEPARPDFHVHFLHDETLTPPAQLSLTQRPDVASAHASRFNAPGTNEDVRIDVPTLTIRYRTDDGLQAAINALLDEEQRRQLNTPQADIDAYRRAPAWARLSTPETLSDFGLSDLRIEGNQQRSLSLPFPPHWQPSGPLQGELRLRGQDGLPGGARLDIWVQDTLSGSQRLDNLTAYDLQRGVPVHASRTSRSPQQGVLLQTQLDVPRPCVMPLEGTVWIDAEESYFQLPHLYKTGAMALIPRLVADPSVYLDTAPDAGLSLLASLMNAHQWVTTRAPIPYNIRHGQPAPEQPPSLYIGIENALGERMAERYPERVSANFAQASLRWQADEEGRSRITAASPEVLRQAARQLASRWYDIPDGAQDLLIHAQEGTLVVLDQRTRTLEDPIRPVDRQTLEWGIMAVALSLVTLLFLVWLYRCRIARQKG